MLELHVFHPTLSNVLSTTQGLKMVLLFITETDIFVFVFDGTADEDELDYVGTLNRALPEDIRVLGWCPVPPGFNARYFNWNVATILGNAINVLS